MRFALYQGRRARREVLHTNMDTFERVDAEALKQASVVLASFANDAAMREGGFPRSATP